MRRQSILLVLALVAVGGCAGESERKPRATNAELKAQETRAKAHAKLEAEVRSAQRKTARRVAAAEADIMRTRALYRNEVEGRLIALDEEIDELEAKALVGEADARLAAKAMLSVVKARRAEFQRRFDELEEVAPQEWDSSRAQLDKQWKALKKLVYSTS